MKVIILFAVLAVASAGKMHNKASIHHDNKEAIDKMTKWFSLNVHPLYAGIKTTQSPYYAPAPVVHTTRAPSPARPSNDPFDQIQSLYQNPTLQNALPPMSQILEARPSSQQNLINTPLDKIHDERIMNMFTSLLEAVQARPGAINLDDLIEFRQ